jgi:hypothetical protein
LAANKPLESGMAVPTMDIIQILQETKSWELASAAALLHHIAMKVPQQPDTAFAIVPSTLLINLIWIGFIPFTPIASLSKWFQFNLTFVASVNALLM